MIQIIDTDVRRKKKLISIISWDYFNVNIKVESNKILINNLILS